MKIGSFKIGVASDHAGKELKQLIVEFMKASDVEVIDYGVVVDSQKSVDYPDYAAAVASDISSKKLDFGILICGTGIGMSIAANKFPYVRAALVWDDFTAKMSRAHNDANVLCLGARTLNHHRAIDLAKLWLETPFEGSRHNLRLEKIREIEKQNFKLI